MRPTLTSNSRPSQCFGKKKHYIGRFAPSPSGPLHLGSLVCALASFLDAKANHGSWLVRIEDIDPPREQAGADQIILDSLQKHGLNWDDEVVYQSTRSQAYREALNIIHERKLSYFCTCNRKRVLDLAGRYDGLCRYQIQNPSVSASIRLNNEAFFSGSDQCISLEDNVQGEVREDFALTGDIIIHRKDGLFAYQLAVSVDDVWQGITHVVRGCDLLEATPKQTLLMKVLGHEAPVYSHIPVLVDSQGRKFSKQNHAEAIQNESALINLKRACLALALTPPDGFKNPHDLIAWATEAWNIKRLKNKKQTYEAETLLV